MAPTSSQTASPSEQTLEGLSALIDGEASNFESRRLLSMANEPELEAKWQSYHLAGTLMRKELEGAPIKDLSFNIAAALAQEPTFNQEPAFNQQEQSPVNAGTTAAQGSNAGHNVLGGRWRDLLAKTAIAASVAFAVIVGVQYSQTGNLIVGGSEEFVAQSSPVNAPVGFDVPSPIARNVSLGSLAEPQRELQPAEPSGEQFLSNAQVEAELQQLFLEHAELSSQNGRFGLMPMARAAKMQTLEK